MLFNRHLCQRSTVGTTMATNPPLLNPLFLHIRLTAGRTNEHAFFIEHSTLFLHSFLSPKQIGGWHKRRGDCKVARSECLLVKVSRESLLDWKRYDHYDAVMRGKSAIDLALCIGMVAGLLFVGMPVCRAADSDLISIQTPSGTTIKAEIADTPLKRSVGLMYRDQLKKDHGMLFFFSQPQAWSFWMKNTKIALDLIWLDGKKQVTHIERNVPVCTKSDDSCPQYRPNNDDAMYVLEITGGTVDGYKIEKGAKLQFGQR